MKRQTKLTRFTCPVCRRVKLLPVQREGVHYYCPCLGKDHETRMMETVISEAVDQLMARLGIKGTK